MENTFLALALEIMFPEKSAESVNCIFAFK